ncbi:hypothetical protein C0Q70_02303 [Pomacea canaliculata]|uniref:Enolase n=1 Tax=Pomacea canaliculata TaxID=400727 RepID=A0A2T7PPI9_POMCA|nr:hypothetical protein C0Q70_02303 [Pomacea canaliculata]
MGKGVQKAVSNVNDVLGPSLIKKNVNLSDQKAIDKILCEIDGTENKGKMGANAILAISMAACKAGAAQKGVPLYQHIADLAGNKRLILPVPAFNVINGGSHAGNKLAMQEFMILPTGATSFTEAMKMGSETYHHLKSVIKKKYGQDACNVGDEGGFAPNIQENEEGLELLREAIEKAGYTGKIKIGMDVAASEFYKEGKYDLDFKNKDSNPESWISSDQLAAMYDGFVSKYPVVSIEDPFDQDDWKAYAQFTANSKIQIVGSVLTVRKQLLNASRCSHPPCFFGQNCIPSCSHHHLLIQSEPVKDLQPPVRLHEHARTATVPALLPEAFSNLFFHKILDIQAKLD